MWLRKQPAIDSSRGFLATNLDFVWQNYKTCDWMLIEEKRYGAKPQFWQAAIFRLLDWCARHHRHYHGFHLVQFENTNPDDGKTWLDGRQVTPAELIAFLQFDAVSEPLPDFLGMKEN